MIEANIVAQKEDYASYLFTIHSQNSSFRGIRFKRSSIIKAAWFFLHSDCGQVIFRPGWGIRHDSPNLQRPYLQGTN